MCHIIHHLADRLWGDGRLMQRDWNDPNHAIKDCTVITGVILLSALPYTHLLGFHADDWAFVSLLKLSTDQSAGALFETLLAEGMSARPVQAINLVMLYKIFHLWATGYHIANVMIFLANGTLLYFCLKELRWPRLLCLAIPLTYILLPHYSTNRFWVAALQIPLSMALYFLSLYCDLRALRAERWRLTIWKTFSLVALIGATLAYETVLPMFLANSLLVWYFMSIKRSEATTPMADEYLSCFTPPTLSLLQSFSHTSPHSSQETRQSSCLNILCDTWLLWYIV
jgi:hypothetical protein